MKAEYVLAVADNIADGKTKGREADEQIRQCEEYTGKRIDRRLSGEQLRIRMRMHTPSGANRQRPRSSALKASTISSNRS